MECIEAGPFFIGWLHVHVTLVRSHPAPLLRLQPRDRSHFPLLPPLPLPPDTELYQQLTFDMGAQVLLVPSAFTVPTGRAHWEVLLRARAIETQCYVVAAAQAGRHNEKRESWGHSLIIDPWGVVIGRLEDPQATGIAVAEVDLAHLRQIRTKMPIAQHRRLGRPALRPGAPT